MLQDFIAVDEKETRAGFGDGIHAFAAENKDVVALTADLAGSLKLNNFIKDFPERFVTDISCVQRDFADVKEKMQDFFDEIDQVKNQMNKYVHKQGLNKFYTYHGSDSSKNKIKRESDFESFLIKSIGAIAIYRLTVDPLPLMLLEDDIYNRTGQLMTESFTSEFIQKYIGQRNIELYKQTNLYQGYYNDIIKNEEMIPPVLSLVKDDFIDRTACEEILTQKHLLNKNDIVAITMTMLLQNLTKIYCIGGFHWYFTSTESVRKNQSYNSEDFDKFKNNTPIYNSNYYEVFLSAIKYK